MANEGVADQVKGAAKETWGNVKQAAQETVDRQRAEHEREANVARDNFTDRVQNVKDKVNERIDEHKEEERIRRRSA
jgi:uncharacterized protein YjbJ (UPF0337 family)